MTRYVLLPTAVRGAVSVMWYILLLAGLDLMIRNFSGAGDRKGRVWSALLFAAAFAQFCFLGINTPSLSDGGGQLPFWPGALLQPWILAAFSLAAAFAGAARLYMRLRRIGRSRITRASVKESFDNLPTGMCYAVRDGLPLLVNHRMESLSHALTGGSLRNAEEFWARLRSGELCGGAEAMAGGARPIAAAGDGRVWLFARKEVFLNGRPVTEITAADATEEYRLGEALRADNERLKGVNLRLRSYGESVREAAREREILDAKIRIHDDMGKALLAAKSCLAADAGADKRAKILELLRLNTELLGRAAETPPASEEALAALVSSAAGIGLAVSVRGELPEDAEAAYLMITAVRECATNAVTHAHGTELYAELARTEGGWIARITNNGDLPDGEIREGGGLGTLRSRVESAGGCMTVSSSPRFELAVFMPEKEEFR